MAAHDRVTPKYHMDGLQRQPELSYRRGDPMANVRMDCLNKDAMTQYFDLFKEVLTENNLMNSPGRIYNVDETGICLDGHAPRVVALKGQKKVRYRTSGNCMCQCQWAGYPTFRDI